MRVTFVIGVLALSLSAVAVGAERQHGRLTYAPAQSAVMVAGASIVASADGRNLYVARGLDNRTRITVFARDPRTGRLSRPPAPDACVAPWYLAPMKTCRTGTGLNNSRVLATSADGRSVAVGAGGGSQLAVYARNRAGGLLVRSCFGFGAPGCQLVRGLYKPEALAFSPDGTSLYVASGPEKPGVLVLKRNAGGTYAQLPGVDGCVQRATPPIPGGPCKTIPVKGFGPTAIAVSPTGTTLVALSWGTEGAGLFVFRRGTTTGRLSLFRCYSKAPPCDPPLDPNVSRYTDLAFAPDGRTIATLTFGHVVSTMEVDPATGILTQLSCAGAAQCDDNARVPRADAIAVAPDGRTVYAGLTAFALGAAGALQRLGSLGPSAGPIAVSPDSRWLYTTAGRAYRAAP